MADLFVCFVSAIVYTKHFTRWSLTKGLVSHISKSYWSSASKGFDICEGSPNYNRNIKKNSCFDYVPLSNANLPVLVIICIKTILTQIITVNERSVW